MLGFLKRLIPFKPHPSLVKDPFWIKPNRGKPLPIIRTCECGNSHHCTETFREMIDRCITEQNGSIVLHDAAENEGVSYTGHSIESGFC